MDHKPSTQTGAGLRQPRISFFFSKLTVRRQLASSDSSWSKERTQGASIQKTQNKGSNETNNTDPSTDTLDRAKRVFPTEETDMRRRRPPCTYTHTPSPIRRPASEPLTSRGPEPEAPRPDCRFGHCSCKTAAPLLRRRRMGPATTAGAQSVSQGQRCKDAARCMGHAACQASVAFGGRCCSRGL